MPKAPIERKKRNYDNGPPNTYRAAKWEQNGKMVAAPRGKYERRGERNVIIGARGR